MIIIKQAETANEFSFEELHDIVALIAMKHGMLAYTCADPWRTGTAGKTETMTSANRSKKYGLIRTGSFCSDRLTT